MSERLETPYINDKLKEKALYVVNKHDSPISATKSLESVDQLKLF